MIYPDNSNATTYSYTSNNIAANLLTAKTGINGIGNSYQYDEAGRLWLVRDQFDNIVEMKKYKLANRHTQQIPSIIVGFTPQETALGSPTIFGAMPPYSYETGDCDAPPIVYTWNFGDGFLANISYGSGRRGITSISHTYSATGTYQVSVTASSPGMTNVFAQTPPVNSTNPPPVKVVVAPPPCYSTGTPLICASGIIQRASTNPCILSSCNDITPPGTCFLTKFKLTDISGGSLGWVYSVEWQIADVGLNNWSTWAPEITGTGGFATERNFHAPSPSYQMRAKIKFCSVGGVVAYSNVITVLNGD
jgi:hypothetical protein